MMVSKVLNLVILTVAAHLFGSYNLKVYSKNSFNDGDEKYIYSKIVGAKNFSEGVAAVCIDTINPFAFSPHKDGFHPKWGFIDTTGTFIISPRFDETASFRYGLCFIKEYSRWGVINKKGEYKIKPLFDEIIIRQNRNGNVYFLTSKSPQAEFYELYDINGNLLNKNIPKLAGLDTTDCIITSNFIAFFSNDKSNDWDFSIVATKNGQLHRRALYINEKQLYVKDGDKWCIIDSNTTIIKKSNYDIANKKYSGRRIVSEGRKCGVINDTGEVIVPCIYDEINNFYNGFAVTRLKNKYGVVDTSGKVVIPLNYDYIRRFHRKGVFCYYLNGLWGLIDKENNIIINPIYPVILGCIGDAFIAKTLGDNATYFTLDLHGNVVYKSKSNWEFLNSESYWGEKNESYYSKKSINIFRILIKETNFLFKTIKKEALVGFDKGGKLVFTPGKYKNYSYIDYDDKNYIGVENDNGEWGFINQCGKEVITPKYNRILSSFRNGVACVEYERFYWNLRSKKTICWIDTNGRILIERLNDNSSKDDVWFPTSEYDRFKVDKLIPVLLYDNRLEKYNILKFMKLDGTYLTEYIFLNHISDYKLTNVEFVGSKFLHLSFGNQEGAYIYIKDFTLSGMKWRSEGNIDFDSIGIIKYNGNKFRDTYNSFMDKFIISDEISIDDLFNCRQFWSLWGITDSLGRTKVRLSETQFPNGGTCIHQFHEGFSVVQQSGDTKYKSSDYEIYKRYYIIDSIGKCLVGNIAEIMKKSDFANREAKASNRYWDLVEKGFEKLADALVDKQNESNDKYTTSSTNNSQEVGNRIIDVRINDRFYNIISNNGEEIGHFVIDNHRLLGFSSEYVVVEDYLNQRLIIFDKHGIRIRDFHIDRTNDVKSVNDEGILVFDRINKVYTLINFEGIQLKWYK